MGFDTPASTVSSGDNRPFHIQVHLINKTVRRVRVRVVVTPMVHSNGTASIFFRICMVHGMDDGAVVRVDNGTVVHTDDEPSFLQMMVSSQFAEKHCHGATVEKSSLMVRGPGSTWS